MMKNKLKMLFAYFRALKDKNIYTHLSLDRDRIEDWGEKFQVNNKYITPAGSIIKIIEELIELYYYDFIRYNDYSVDDYWYLEIHIRPFDNTLFFTSECKVEKERRNKKQYDFKDLKQENKDFINKIYEENEDLTKFEIQFTGRWDDGNINRVYFDNRRHNFDDDDGFWGLVVDLMHKAEGGPYWNEGPGAEGDLVVWDSVMFLDYIKYEEEYEDTGMSIEVTPDNVKEE
jgi:hypothetical protein